MKIVVCGRYRIIDILLKEIKCHNFSKKISVEYPEAYYHSKKNWKGVVLIHTEDDYLDFKIIGDKRFRSLEVSVTNTRYVWIKCSGACFISCRSSCLEEFNSAAVEEPEDEPSEELDSYETLDLWEIRTGRYQSY